MGLAESNGRLLLNTHTPYTHARAHTHAIHACTHACTHAHTHTQLFYSSHWPMDNAVVRFLTYLDREISERSGELPDGHFLFHWISVLFQHFNLIFSMKHFQVMMGSTCSHSSMFSVFLVFKPGIFTTWG